MSDDKIKRPNYADLFEKMVVEPLLEESKRTGLHPYDIMAGVTVEQRKFMDNLFPKGPNMHKKKRRSKK